MPLKGSPLINLSHWQLNTNMNFGKDKAYSNHSEQTWNFMTSRLMVFIDVYRVKNVDIIGVWRYWC